MRRGLILFGPPAAGKDTITRELMTRNARYVHYQRLKVGPGRTHGYQMTTNAELAARRARGSLMYENHRYQATYAVDRVDLIAIADHGQVPVLHLGQIEGIAATVADEAIQWLVVALWCSREQTAQRLVARGDHRINERLSAWDSTLVDVRAAEPAIFHLALNTIAISAERAAEVIDICNHP